MKNIDKLNFFKKNFLNPNFGWSLLKRGGIKFHAEQVRFGWHTVSYDFPPTPLPPSFSLFQWYCVLQPEYEFSLSLKIELCVMADLFGQILT